MDMRAKMKQAYNNYVYVGENETFNADKMSQIQSPFWQHQFKNIAPPE